jgi:glyoxylate/hydroxypyruvate reductase A
MAVLILSKPIPHEPLVQALAERGFAHPVYTSLDGVDPDTVRWLVAWRLPAGVLPRLSRLELLFCCAAGADKLLATPDLPSGLPMSRVTDDAQAIELAQYVVHAALDHLRIAPRYRAQQLARDWSRHRAPAVGVPALVLGLGPNGADGLAAALPAAQVLACALPLTPQTHGLIDATVLERLPRGAFVVNIGRGGQIVESDLVAALRSGHLGGAALDVQAREPMPADDPMWDAPNLTITPHVAGQLDPRAVMSQFVDEVERLARGEPLRNRIDPTRGY